MDAKTESARRGTKLKRKVNVLSDEGQVRTSPQKQMKKGSIAGAQPQQASKGTRKVQTAKLSMIGGQVRVHLRFLLVLTHTIRLAVTMHSAVKVGKATPNPVFARSKQKTHQVGDAIDLTAPSIKAAMSATCCKMLCPIGSALPPVHILPNLGSALLPTSSKRLGSRIISHQRRDSLQACHSNSAMLPFLGDLLQQEDHVSAAFADKQEAIDSAISDRLVQFLRHPTTEKSDGVPDCVDVPGKGLETPAQTKAISYLHDVIYSSQNTSPRRSDSSRWIEHLEELHERARRAAHEQLPWVSKYAPAVADRVVANTAASKELLAWLKQVEPIEAALTSMRSGQMCVLQLRVHT